MSFRLRPKIKGKESLTQRRKGATKSDLRCAVASLRETSSAVCVEGCPCSLGFRQNENCWRSHRHTQVTPSQKRRHDGLLTLEYNGESRSFETSRSKPDLPRTKLTMLISQLICHKSSFLYKKISRLFC